MKFSEKATTPLDGIIIVPEPSVEVLIRHRQFDSRNQREQCLEWLLVFGRDPKTRGTLKRHTITPARGSVHLCTASQVTDEVVGEEAVNAIRLPVVVRPHNRVANPLDYLPVRFLLSRHLSDTEALYAV